MPALVARVSGSFEERLQRFHHLESTKTSIRRAFHSRRSRKMDRLGLGLIAAKYLVHVFGCENNANRTLLRCGASRLNIEGRREPQSIDAEFADDRRASWRIQISCWSSCGVEDTAPEPGFLDQRA